MTDRSEVLTETFMAEIREKNPGEDLFLQAVEEIARDVITVEKANADYAAAKILARLAEPDRMIQFRITWPDDAGNVQINRGWRVQHSNAVGPYKGGLRFASTVTPSVLKFLGFEQTFKNALTGLNLGGAKGGSDFEPKDHTEREIMRFCHAFMAELQYHIGPSRDIPAGDIGVGTREIGHLFSAWKKHNLDFAGVITGKSLCIGGSQLRVEATGYGLIYFLCAMLDAAGEDVQGKRIVISGMGNVAMHAARKACALGARVVSLSDTSGLLEAPDGMTNAALDWIEARKAMKETISEPPKDLGLKYHPGGTPWGIECDVALPCATQNEVGEGDARAIVAAGCGFLAEGANMPLTSDAQKLVRDSSMRYAPGKIANAGGVAVSGLEMSQNATFRPLSASEVDDTLRDIMVRVHKTVRDEAATDQTRGPGIDYRRAANRAAYRRVAEALLDHGVL
ncbi:NADP-specific glutamate dehydrogenase [Roseovarius sp. D0-M9]|uniref:NADP-specific glutamate dehydrogenase n=1 Tax=Roseovarius sp. D0-M9 TaxID=3127117 RepID=UPI00300FCC38